MLIIGNDELEKNKDVGKSVLCECGQHHDIQYGEEVLRDGTKKKSTMLAFYKCGETAYLAGINGKRI